MNSGSSILIIVFLISGLLLGGIADLSGSSEARELEVVRSVLHGSDPILPRRLDMVPSKPPLLHWLSAAVVRGFQPAVTPMSTRAVSYLAAAFLLFLTALLAGYLEDENSQGLSLLSAGILASTYGFLRMAGSGRVDMLFSLLVAMAVACVLVPVYLQDEHTPKRQEPWYSMFAIASALAVLTKGPLGLALPVLTIWALLIFKWGFRTATLALIRPRWQWLIFFAVALPWYIYSFSGYSDGFSSRVLFENVTRFLGGEHIVSKPFWFYLPSFLLKSFPWSLFFVLAVWMCFWSDRDGSLTTKCKPFLIWFAVGFVLFSLADGKRHSYLTPLFPASSIISALCLYELFKYSSDELKRRARGVLRVFPLIALCLASCAAAFASCFAGIQEMYPDTLLVQSTEWYIQNQILVVVMLFSLMLYSGITFVRQRGLFLMFWVFLVVAMLFVVQTGLAVKADLKSYILWARSIEDHLNKEQKNFVLVKDPEDELFDPVIFYLNRIPKLMTPKDSLRNLTCRDIFLTRLEFLQEWHIAVDSYNLLSDKLENKTNRAIVLGVMKDC